MNFYSTLCLIHSPDKLGQLRGHYTDGTTLFARQGIKKLSDYKYKIDFNRIFFQQREIYSETVKQILEMIENGSVTTMLLLTNNQQYRFQFLREIIRQTQDKQKVYLIDFKKLNKQEESKDMQDVMEELQQLNFEALELLSSQVKHRRSMNSMKISLKIVANDKQFILNLLQVNLSNSKDTELLHRQFKALFQQGVIDEQVHGIRSRQLNQSSNIMLITYLTFQQKKRLEQECYLQFLSRIKYSSDVQKIKQNKHFERMVSELTNLKQTKEKVSQEIEFYNTMKGDLNRLIGKQLKIIRKLNIKYQDIQQYKNKLKQGMERRKSQIKELKQKIIQCQNKQQKQQSQPEYVSSFFKRVKDKLQTKLNFLTQVLSQKQYDSKVDLNQSIFSRSTTSYSRPQSAIRSKYLDFSKSIINKQNQKMKTYIQQLQLQHQQLIEAKKQEINNLPQLTQLYGLMKKMTESNRNTLIMKYGL